jgi:hypothetical protein
MPATRTALFVLAMGILLLVWREGDAEEAKQSQPPSSVTLTNDNSSGYFAIDRETLDHAPGLLLVRVTDVFNPEKTGFHLLAYLSNQVGAEHAGAAQSQPEKVLIGDLGFFPADRPAAFQLRASKAFDELKSRRGTPTDVRLLFQLKCLHETDPCTAIKVTIATPVWKPEVEN